MGHWACVEYDGITHVVPLGDLKPHSVGVVCWCRPVEDAEESTVLIHQALDQREKYETGELKPQ